MKQQHSTIKVTVLNPHLWATLRDEVPLREYPFIQDRNEVGMGGGRLQTGGNGNGTGYGGGTSSICSK